MRRLDSRLRRSDKYRQTRSCPSNSSIVRHSGAILLSWRTIFRYRCPITDIPISETDIAGSCTNVGSIFSVA
jgi:hypothetical protein